MNIGTINLAKSAFIIAALLLVFGLSNTAQAATTVTIKFDDGEGITGELIESTDDNVRLDTLMGLVTIPMVGVSCIGAACPEAIRLKVDDAPLVLTSIDGSTQVTGNLIEVLDDQYILATDIGELRVDMDRVTCEGTACPTLVSQPEFGGEVVLANGITTIEGTLIGLEDDAYLLDVDVLGTMRVSRDFQCSGDGCPIQ